MFRKNQQLQLEITDLTDQGEGIGRCDDFAVFVKDTVPGDLVTCAVTKVKKTYAYARLLEVIRPSRDRVEPACPAARPCGGCQLQMMSYAAQLAYKEKRVRNALARVGGFPDAPVAPILGAEEPFRYRNKAQYPVGTNRNGELVASFYAGRTHSIISVDDCLLGPEENAEIVRDVLARMRENNIPAYDETTGEGEVRHIIIRQGFATGERLVCLVINAKHDRQMGPAAEKKVSKYYVPIETFPLFSNFAINYNPDRTNVILGDHTEVIAGKGYIEDCVGDLRYRISVESFYQVNPRQTKKLYDKVREYAALTGEETVWDLYCGIGTIGLYLARDAKKVIGMELVPRAVEDARENARLNGIGNAEFYCEDLTAGATDGIAERLLAEIKTRSANRRDIIIVDPPRKGCDQKLLADILAASPEKIIYVSCDPATLARDLKILCAKDYTLREAQPVDMFPQTAHVETVVLMTRA